MEQPDTQEKAIRFGCGFLFGALLVAGSSITWSLASHYYYLTAAVLVGVLFGFLPFVTEMRSGRVFLIGFGGGGDGNAFPTYSTLAA